MKPIFILVCCALLHANCNAQKEAEEYTEFGKLYNGLIYPDTTVKKLRHIVDSLNLKFKVCEPKTFYSKLQGKAHYVSVAKNRVKEALQDIRKGMNYDDFICKYANAAIAKDLLVVRFIYTDYSGNEVIRYSSIKLGKLGGHEIMPAKDAFSQSQQCVYAYYEKTKYSDESVKVFFFTEDPKINPLPAAYNLMVQYSECMVDTTAQVIKETATRGDYSDIKNESLQKFEKFINDQTNKPELRGKNEDEFWRQYSYWDSVKYEQIRVLARTNNQFYILLNAAITETLQKGGSNDFFETLVESYYSKQTALELKRNRRVVGGCSQDQSPRIHAVNIARLSAEAVKWEVFLRSHLDIMNDRFERASDGSYAWAQRKTYIKELEVLDINVHDLLLGITLRVENPGQNHYFGSIGRLGRALAETKNTAAIEEKMLHMIKDAALDDYNRVLVYFLFLNYNHHLDDKAQQQLNVQKVKEAVKSLPKYLADHAQPGED